MQIGSIMVKKVIKVGMDDTIDMVKEIFDTFSFHHLLVVRGTGLIGIISDRDLLRALSSVSNVDSDDPDNDGGSPRYAHQIMTRNPITVTEATEITEAANLILDNNISCLPVVTAKGEVQGIATWKDLLRHYSKK